jgi:hypothetical protein
MLFGCSNTSTDAGFSSLEAGGEVLNSKCTISSFSPAEKSLRVSGKSGTLTNFSVIPSSANCLVTYTVNNKAVSVEVNSGFINIDSDLLNEGENLVTAKAASSSTSDFIVWTVKKNKAPDCVSQLPNPTGSIISLPSSLNLTANGSDADNDALTFSWKLNNRLASDVFSGLISGSSASTVTFTPKVSLVGNNTITAEISDGLDQTSCEWTVNISGDCGIASSAPSGSIVRVASNGETQTSFGVNTNSLGCTASWSLNGVALAETSTTNQITSSLLNVGNNILTAAIGSGTTMITRTWMVVKNSPPTCLSQTPTNSASLLTGVGVPKTLIANADDTNGDTITFSWSINGIAAGSTIATSSSGQTGNGIFIATSNNVGTNTITATMSDGYDTGSCSWVASTVDNCVVTSALPTSGTVRISNAGLPLAFSVVPNDVNCAVTWKINGVTGTTGNFSDLYPSNANLLAPPGTNSITATLNNGIHSPIVKTWTVIKNTPPTCLSPSPVSYTGNTLAIPAALSFGMVSGDANSDNLSFIWKVNGAANSSALGTAINGSNASLVTFTPTGQNIGNNIISLDVSDGFDTTQCAWNLSVSGDCAVTSESPSTASQVRVAASGSTLNTFSLTTTTAGCGATWTLNGNSISGVGLSQQIQSSQLLTGANSLTATAANGSSSTVKTWIILKNNLPVCTTSPSNVGPVSAGVGVPKSFVATASDADSDAITFDWLYNNVNPGTLISSSATGNVGTGIYTGTLSTLGVGVITAVMNDGLDTNRCDWDITTFNACSVSSSLPSGASLRMAAFGGVQTFGIVPNNSSCNISWELNGSSIGSGNFFDLYSANAALVTGSNTLVATLSNGIHSNVTRSWTITKNTPPSCSATSPTGTIGIDYGTTQNLNGTIANADSDPLTFAWTFDGGSASLFTGISSSGTTTATALATITPVFANIGVGHFAAVTASDGYDTGQCAWTIDVQDPSQVQISSCLPVENPAVILSQGADATRVFTVSATGPSLSYQWQLDGVNVGSNSSTNSFSSGALTVGTHSAKVTVTDLYNHTLNCTWNLKRNAPPVISSYLPSAGLSTKLNITNTLNLSATATDGNNDTLNYTWTINGGVNNSVLSSGLSSSQFNPNNNTAYLGSNTLAVSVSDGYESVTQSWTVEGNYFSNECNTIYNGTVGTTGGRICTLVGQPGVGSGLDPIADQNLIKTQPTYIINDGADNLIFSDIHSHSVFFYNRSVNPITIFGKLIPAGRIVAILGNGFNGRNDDFSANTDFKLSTPYGLAFDANNQKLFIADNINHRVVMLDNAGQARTVFGTLTTTQNATTNADGSIGTALVCNSPQDLLIQGTWLYISCYGMSAIKKMDIDPLSATYLKGYMVVGYLNASSTVVAGNSDGSPGTAGLARANGPIGLAADGDGNIYWTEWATSRVRMLNLSGSDKSFFSSRSVSANFNISMADLSAPALTAPSNLVVKAETSSTVPNTLYPWGPTTVVTNTCVHYRVQSRIGTVPSKAQSNITVNLSSGGIGTIYSDSNCSSTATTVQISTGSAEADFYYKRASGTGAVTLTISGLTGSPTIPVTVSAAGGVATRFISFGPNSFEYSTCTKIMLQVRDASNLPTTSSTNRTILLANDNTGNFYADAACSTTPISSVTLTAAVTRESYIYFAKTTIAPAGNVVSLFGNNNSQLYSAGGVSSLTIRQPRDLLVDYSGSTINGFFVSSNNTTGVDTHHRIVYVNNTTTNRTFGGTTLYAYNQGAVAGANHGGAAVAGATSSGYNGDDTLGNLAMLFYPWGLTYDYTKSKILFGDNLNNRIRAFDISSSVGNVTTVLGNGYLRNGTASLDSLTPATSAFLNSPSKLVIDSTTRTMYISDTANGRIRRLDMLKGYVDRAVGAGIGSGNTEAADPNTVLTRSLRGMTIATSSGTNRFLIFADNEAAAAAPNKTCLVRALNLGSSTASIFGVSIPANRVSTVAGDYTQGCGSFNTNGSGAGISRYLNQPEDVAFDGTNLYVIAYGDNCILKLDSTGYMSPIMGTCGGSGNVDGYTPISGSVAQILNPMGIVPDFDNIGNFFIADQVATNTGKIRYVNTTISNINIGGTTAFANAAGNLSRTTSIWNLIPAGGVASRINSLAAFGNIICWAAGLNGDGNTGPHAVYCADKTTGTVSRKAGPSESSSNYIRGGAPLGNEQENVPGVSAYLAAPYGLTFDSDGNLYIVEKSAHTVRMMRRWF